MAFEPKDIEVFYSPNSRGRNDLFSKKREAIFEFIVRGRLADSPPQHARDPQHGLSWQSLHLAVDDLLRQLAPDGAELTAIIPRGGRSFNFDFELHYKSKSGEVSIVQVELKKGGSIYDQPEFLSLYATNELVEGRTYPEFFYDEYVSRAIEFRRFNPPTREEYLRLIMGTIYSRHKFFEGLYNLDNSADAPSLLEKDRRFLLVDKSIDRYLKEHALQGLKTEVLQKRLDQQIPKRFVSWDMRVKKFNVESFSHSDVTMVGKPSLKSSRAGLANTITLTMESGNQVHALLRWKNHKGVLGPAWQIKMIPK